MPRIMHNVRSMPGEFSRLPKSVKGITLVIFLYYLSWSLVEPFLPIYFTEVLGSYSSTTLVVALLYLFGVLWSFPVGEFLDRYSKRRWLRVILLLYLPLWPWLVFLRTVAQFVVFRLYHSFLAMNLWGAAESYLRSHSPDHRHAESVGFYDVGVSLAMIVGAVAGGALLLLFDLRAVIVSFPVALVIIAFWAASRLPERGGGSSLKQSVHSIDWRHLFVKEVRDAWAQPAFRSILLLAFVLGILGVPQMTLLPLLADALGASSLTTGVVYAFFVAPFLLEAPFSILADRWSRRALLMIGSGVATLAFIGLSEIDSVVFLFPFAFVLGAAIAMVRPVVSGTATAFMVRGHEGEMNGVYTAASSLGGFLALVALGPLADARGIHITFFASGVLMAVFLVLAAVLWPFVENRLRENEKVAF